jgi:uncharacterized C2H2 Zn-finger protein
MHTCPHCAVAFGEAGSLTKHVRAVHEKRRDRACPHCAAAYAQASNLTKHGQHNKRTVNEVFRC